MIPYLLCYYHGAMCTMIERRIAIPGDDHYALYPAIRISTFI